MKKVGVRSPKSEPQRPTSAGTRKDGSKSRNKKRGQRGLPFTNSGLRTPNPQLRTLIIGYGNPLRSDDGFGWHVSGSLAQALEGQDIEVMTCHQLTPELAETLSRCRRAVFIDADAEGKPGAVHSRAIHPQAHASSWFTHTCTPSGLLASAKQLYGHHPEAIVITVSAQSFEFGDVLSPIVASALPKVVEQVCEWVGFQGS